ncbi:hypothetical protein DPMN_133492 [Dreissena polymorpha]|uniref:Uncharacterized protein n=1 Tax=Dreissena polymorpha TaxID=45954 RepID=A0A9D4FUD5_DREPO|nr:hypothetical protein DPMN_133492 [Dreissena polymorpha]
MRVPSERLTCIECMLAKGVAYPPPTSLKDAFFHWLLLRSSSLFFIGVLFWSADLEALLEAGVDENLYFLYGCDNGSSGFCSIEEKWLHNGIEEPILGGDANFAGYPVVFSWCFTVAIISSY